MEFSRTTLNIDTLLFAYGPDPKAVDERITTYAKEKTISLKDKYFFRLTVTQKGVETITHIIYDVVNKARRAVGSSIVSILNTIILLKLASLTRNFYTS